jgi:ribosome-associated heat shock protein Hsp15
METRIDKYLWEVRLYKTRSQAAEACCRGHIFVNGLQSKSSKTVKIGDELQVKRNPIVYSFKILGLPVSRVGAKLVENYLLNITTPEQIAAIEILKLNQQHQRAKGLGRPTKKDRRDIEYFFFNDGDL